MPSSLQRDNTFLRFIYPYEVPLGSICVWDLLLHAMLSPLKWVLVLFRALLHAVVQCIFKSGWGLFVGNEFPAFTSRHPDWKSKSRRLAWRLTNYQTTWCVRRGFRIMGIPLMPTIAAGLLLYGPGQFFLYVLSELVVMDVAARDLTSPVPTELLPWPEVQWWYFAALPVLLVFGHLYGATKIGAKWEPLFEKICLPIHIVP